MSVLCLLCQALEREAQAAMPQGAAPVVSFPVNVQGVSVRCAVKSGPTAASLPGFGDPLGQNLLVLSIDSRRWGVLDISSRESNRRTKLVSLEPGRRRDLRDNSS